LEARSHETLPIEHATNQGPHEALPIEHATPPPEQGSLPEKAQNLKVARGQREVGSTVIPRRVEKTRPYQGLGPEHSLENFSWRSNHSKRHAHGKDKGGRPL